MNIYRILDLINVKYKVIKHPPISELKQAKEIKQKLNGVFCKSFLVTDKKGRYFLIVYEESKTVNLQTLAQKIRVSELTYASELDIIGILRTKPGNVTPFDISVDYNKRVMLIIDSKLQDKNVLFQLNGNTQTLALKFRDFMKYIIYEEHKSVLI